MGRKVRRVPPHWQHPKDKDGHYQPMYDETFETAAAKWKADFLAWERGERGGYDPKEDGPLEYWEWNGNPPERKYYRPWQDEDATWFQLWETVSEGTPVSPPFATLQELADHLAAHGSDWDHGKGWGREAADAFVKAGSAPSMLIVRRDESNATIVESKDIPLYFERQKH